jgi:Flp pilus assembly pilin Flp
MKNQKGQSILEYAVLLAVLLLVVVGAIKLIGTNVSTIYSNAASSLQ